MKKYLIAILLAAVAWVTPAASASDRAQFTPAVYTGSGEAQFELVGKRNKHRHHRHHRHRSHRSHRHNHRYHSDYHHHHHHHGYYDRRYRDYYINIPGLGSFYYRK